VRDLRQRLTFICSIVIMLVGNKVISSFPHPEISLSRFTSHLTPHTSHLTRHTSHVTRHTPHVTRHTSHATRHTSHVTRHTSHATRHTSCQSDLRHLRAVQTDEVALTPIHPKHQNPFVSFLTTPCCSSPIADSRDRLRLTQRRMGWVAFGWRRVGLGCNKKTIVTCLQLSFIETSALDSTNVEQVNIPALLLSFPPASSLSPLHHSHFIHPLYAAC
jgi:hypothetical protein